jgi:chemotaxis response regulator CheB
LASPWEGLRRSDRCWAVCPVISPCRSSSCIISALIPEASWRFCSTGSAACMSRRRTSTVYLAPPNYHLLVEGDGRLALSTDPPVNFARPSVDVLFESAAHAYGPELIGIILTGAGSDGSRGLKTITDKGGLAIIQDPVDADADSMPRSALATVGTGHVLPLLDISRFLCTLAEKGDTKTEETCPPAKE